MPDDDDSYKFLKDMREKFIKLDDNDLRIQRKNRFFSMYKNIQIIIAGLTVFLAFLWKLAQNMAKLS